MIEHLTLQSEVYKLSHGHKCDKYKGENVFISPQEAWPCSWHWGLQSLMHLSNPCFPSWQCRSKRLAKSRQTRKALQRWHQEAQSSQVLGIHRFQSAQTHFTMWEWYTSVYKSLNPWVWGASIENLSRLNSKPGVSQHTSASHAQYKNHSAYHRVRGQVRSQMLLHTNRSHTRTTTTMGNTESLVQVQMANICSNVPRAGQSYLWSDN